MVNAFILAIAVSAFIPILSDRPDRRPGNLAPIQIISALGAWALILADASALALGIRDGSLVLLCAASATLAIALISLLRDNSVSRSDREMPQAVRLVVDDLEQVLGRASRLGLESLEAVVVGGRGPAIGVSVKQGRVIVRVRSDVSRWLDQSQRRGGSRAETIASFARFTVLHEIAHVLNGDHRTFRFVRSVVVAQLVWVAGAVAAGASLAANPRASAIPLIISASIVILFAAQSLVARLFIAERERLADWRAMQTLPPADAARLLDRRGRWRGLSNPTELEKLMAYLKVQVPPGEGHQILARIIAIVWPDGGDIHRRSERVDGDHGADAPRPVLWAALMGMQCGWFFTSLSLAWMLSANPWELSQDTVFLGMFVMVALIGTPASVFCELRVDPARMSVRRVERTSGRIVVGVVFYLAFVASAVALRRFHVRLGIGAMPADPIFAVILLGLAGVVGIGTWLSGTSGTDDGGGALKMAPRSSWIVLFPPLAGMGLLLIPLSAAACHWLKIGTFWSGLWVPVMLMSFAFFIASTAMARSTNPALRVIAPMALLDTPAPVYGLRIFWCDFYVDLSRSTLARSVLAMMVLQVAAMPFFVLGAVMITLALRAVFPANTVLVATFLGAIGMMGLILIIPDRYGAFRGASARLLDTSRLQLFERLIAAAQTTNPAAADRLKASIGTWIQNARFPDAVLPDPRCLWPLTPLLSLVRLARATGEWAVLERWGRPIEESLRRIVVNEAVAIAPGQPPSMHWTTIAVTIIDEAELHDAFPFETMLHRIEVLLDERLEYGTTNLLADVVAAGTLLCRHGRRGLDPARVRGLVRSSSLIARPALRQSLAEICELADLTADAELRERLAPILRARFWEVLQLNPRKDVLLLLDCQLAAACLGVNDMRHAAAGVLIGELADRVAAELMEVAKMTSGAQ